MLPKTMERLVGAQAWLKEGIIPEGVFEEAARALQGYIDKEAKKSKSRRRGSPGFDAFHFFFPSFPSFVST